MGFAFPDRLRVHNESALPRSEAKPGAALSAASCQSANISDFRHQGESFGPACQAGQKPDAGES